MTLERTSNGSDWESQVLGPQEHSLNSNFDQPDSEKKEHIFFGFRLRNSDSVNPFCRVFTWMQMVGMFQ